MNPQSKYAVDTRRMMCTGKPRQGIKAWPMDRNIPGNELLGRYDLYPDPRGKESKSDPKFDPPPTQAPQAPNEAEVQGVVLRRLSRKTNCAGADTTLDAWTQRNRDKIRDLQLRRALTGSVKRPRTRAVTENSRRNESVMISDDAALLGYLGEPPKLRRLTRKTKAPEGYVMYGPKDVHEAVQEYLQVDPSTPVKGREVTPQGPKAMHNQRALDEAVMFVGQDNKGQGKISRVGESPETGAASSQAPLVPEVSTYGIPMPGAHLHLLRKDLLPSRDRAPSGQLQVNLQDWVCSTRQGRILPKITQVQSPGRSRRRGR